MAFKMPFKRFTKRFMCTNCCHDFLYIKNCFSLCFILQIYESFIYFQIFFKNFYKKQILNL
jgi:hypothetical protein